VKLSLICIDVKITSKINRAAVEELVAHLGDIQHRGQPTQGHTTQEPDNSETHNTGDTQHGANTALGTHITGDTQGGGG
jgi:hypothetical protein